MERAGLLLQKRGKKRRRETHRKDSGQTGATKRNAPARPGRSNQQVYRTMRVMPVNQKLGGKEGKVEVRSRPRAGPDMVEIFDRGRLPKAAHSANDRAE